MATEQTNILTIHTPEGVVFPLRLAGPPVRFLAFALDLFCIMAISRIIGMVIPLLGLISRDVLTAVSILTYFAVSLSYGFLMEWFMNGQTLGKRLFHLRVMDVQGLNLTFSQVVLRNLLRFVDALPGFYMVGGLSVLMSRHCQRLGDLAANTVVVWTPSPDRPDFTQLFSGKFNSFTSYPHLCARLRQTVSPHEADLALSALLRRDGFDPEARVTVFRSLKDHFQSRLPFPQDATDGLSDEQIIRNLVGVLFQK